MSEFMKSLPYRSQCQCPCHGPIGGLHIAPCCQADPDTTIVFEGDTVRGELRPDAGGNLNWFETYREQITIDPPEPEKPR